MHRVAAYVRSAGRPSPGWVRPDGVDGILLRDDTAPGGERLLLAVAAAPGLVRDPDPVLSLTLVLSREPDVAAPLVLPLVERGVLAFDATLSPPGQALAGLRAPDARVGVLVPQRTRWTLAD